MNKKLTKKEQRIYDSLIGGMITVKYGVATGTTASGSRTTAFAVKLVNKFRELGLIEPANDLSTTENIYRVIDPDPEPPTPKPLPTATIGQVDTPKSFSRSDWRWSKYNSHSKPANYLSVTHFDNLSKMSFKGEIVALQDNITGATWNIDFAEEHEGDFIYVIMYVNGRIYRVNTYTAYRSSLRLVERWTEDNSEWHVNYPAIRIYEGSARQAASWLTTLFETYLLREVVTEVIKPETVAQVAIVEKVDNKPVIPYAVGDTVEYNGKSREIVYILEKGQGGQPYLGIKVPIVVKQESKTTIIFRPLAEFIALQAVA